MALGVADAQCGLSPGIILLGRFAKPFHRLRIILRHTLANGVADAQTELSVGEILLGSFAKPLHCFRLILCHAKGAGKECATQFIPGLGITFVRSGADFGKYLAVRLVLLSQQLKDSGSHQQQNREQQLIRFHIGRLVGHPLPLFKLARVLVRFDRVACIIVNAHIGSA